MTGQRVLCVGQPTFRQQVASALELSPEMVPWVSSAVAAEKQLIDGEGQTRLVAVCPEISESDVLHIAEFVGRAYPATAVVVARRDLNGDLATLVRAGVRDVIDLSDGRDELQASLQRSLQWAENLRAATSDRNEAGARLGKIVTVFSSKGGAGKSFLATNLAAALSASANRATAVVDLDFGMGDVFSYYGGEPKHPLEDLFAPGGLANREVILRSGTPLGDNLWGYGTPTDPTASAVPAAGIGKILRGLQLHFDFVVIDGPAEYSDQMLAAFDASDVVYVIATLDVVGVKHLTIGVQTLQGIGLSDEKLRVILNRADSKVGISPEDVQRVTGLKIDAMVPSSRLVPASLNKGIPVVRDEPKSELAKAVFELADKLVLELGGPPSQRGGPTENRIRRLFRN